MAEQNASRGAYSATLKALGKLAAEARAGCPGVLAGAPLRKEDAQVNQSARDISQELFSVVLGTGGRVEHPLLARFARKVRRLRWSSPRLTRLVHSYAIEQAEQSGVAPANLCADLKAWVASGYATVSKDTERFLHRLDVISSITLIESEPGDPSTFNVDEIIAHRLKPYEDHADRVLARRLRQPKTKITNPAFKTFLEAAGKVYAALEAPAPTPAYSG